MLPFMRVLRSNCSYFTYFVRFRSFPFRKLGKEIKDHLACYPVLSFSLYCLAFAFKHYQQVYIVHSGLQDESLQVTISKLPSGSLTCTRDDFPCTGDIQLMSRSEGRCTYLVSSLQMTVEKVCSDSEIFLAAGGDRTWDL